LLLDKCDKKKAAAMSWNYRVFRTDYTDYTESTYSIREVYYANDGSVKGCTARDAVPIAASADELRAVLWMMLAALDKPTLIEAGGKMKEMT
jgi:hypothetical protein